MQKRYLDNAATTFPKPEAVARALYRYMTEEGCSINRGSYDAAYSVEEQVLETRQLLSRLFNAADCKNVVFTKNVTESLNVILKGFLRSGDHVLVSAMEHNAVMRPLVQLEGNGVTFSSIPCTDEGELILSEMEALLRENTRAVVMTHASNVCGTIMPLREVGKFCRDHGLKFIVDCAQTAGVLPIDMEDMCIDALAFTGHKGLLGPQGTGGFILREDMISLVSPLLSGGTGSMSHSEEMPDFMPDRFEAGTPNIPGIMGLRTALLWLMETGIDNILKHEKELTSAFLAGLMSMESDGLLRIAGKKDTKNRIGVVSLQTLTRELSDVAWELDEKYGIMTRVGLHCAPTAHKALGTYPTGTIRFSFGWWNDMTDVAAALTALEEICHGI